MNFQLQEEWICYLLVLAKLRRANSNVHFARDGLSMKSVIEGDYFFDISTIFVLCYDKEFSLLSELTNTLSDHLKLSLTIE